jgi:hypothetical protein
MTELSRCGCLTLKQWQRVKNYYLFEPVILFAGKSNLTDAIGFVLNEKASRLRVSNMGVSLCFESIELKYVNFISYSNPLDNLKFD